ncbi:MAG: aminopeptidase [Candidatus Margulisiibacteriota bacterium]|jgi:hypothetical protein
MIIGTTAKMTASARGILQHTLKVKPGERVYVTHDAPRAAVGAAFISAAKDLGHEVRSFDLGERRFEDGGIDNLLASVSEGGPYVFVNTFTSGVTREGKPETPFRIQLLSYQIGRKLAEKMKDIPRHLIPIGQQSRVMHSPGITDEALQWDVDYGIMAQRMAVLNEAYQGAKAVKIETQRGTSLMLGIGNRPLHCELTIEKPGTFGNWPPGEAYFAPLEDSANGIAIVDGTIGDFGVPAAPIRFGFRNGVIKNIEYLGQSRTDLFLTRLLDAIWQKDDPQAAVIGELGIGVADFPQTGEMLFDEKIYGTVHFAAGGNEEFGGVNTSQTHRDHLMWHPTLTLIDADGSSRVVMRDGKIV